MRLDMDIEHFGSNFCGDRQIYFSQLNIYNWNFDLKFKENINYYPKYSKIHITHFPPKVDLEQRGSMSIELVATLT